jgi:hypothetical protein
MHYSQGITLEQRAGRPSPRSSSCKLIAVDPLAYLTATLTAIVNGHKQSRINMLLPWNYLVE